MYPRIPWEVVADPLGCAEHSLVTIDVCNTVIPRRTSAHLRFPGGPSPAFTIPTHITHVPLSMLLGRRLYRKGLYLRSRSLVEHF